MERKYDKNNTLFVRCIIYEYIIPTEQCTIESSA